MRWRYSNQNHRHGRFLATKGSEAMSDSKEYILRKPLKPHEIQYWDFVFNKASFPNAFREVKREQTPERLIR